MTTATVGAPTVCSQCGAGNPRHVLVIGLTVEAPAPLVSMLLQPWCVTCVAKAWWEGRLVHVPS